MTHDFSYWIALAVTHHTKGIPELVRIKDLMIGLGKDFQNSYQKTMEYQRVFQVLEEDIVEFEVCPATLWTYMKKTCGKLIHVLFEVVSYLENRVERVQEGEAEDPTAGARFNELKDVTLLAAIHCLMNILDPIMQLNIRTQG